MTMTKKTVTFESAMERLEEILHKLESGSENLDDALKLYEEGISLIRACSERLENAEQRVKLLQLQADGTLAEKDFGKAEDAQ